MMHIWFVVEIIVIHVCFNTDPTNKDKMKAKANIFSDRINFEFLHPT